MLRSTPAVLNNWLRNLEAENQHKALCNREQNAFGIIAQVDQREKMVFLALLQSVAENPNGNPFFFNISDNQNSKNRPKTSNPIEIFTHFLENRKRSLVHLENILANRKFQIVIENTGTMMRIIHDFRIEIASQDRQYLHRHFEIINI